jgi:hypothetical protein
MARLAAWIFGSAIAVVTSSHAAEIESSIFKEGKAVISLEGEIVAGDGERLNSRIREANEQNIVVSGIRLNSPGGLLLEGVKLAEIILQANIATVVANGKLCASACFLAFAAGGEKYVSYSGKVGVHGASADGVESPESGAATVGMARFSRELGRSREHHRQNGGDAPF